MSVEQSHGDGPVRSMSILSRALIALVAGAGLVIGCLAVADHHEGAPKTVRVEAKEGQKLLDRLHALRPDVPIQSVTASPVDGIVQLNLDDGSAFYGTVDGKFLFAGELYRLDGPELVSVDEQRRSKKRRALLADLNHEELVTFGASGKKKAAMYVFTDVDCGFCQKLHLEVPELNSMGVEVNYLAYPRAGINSESYNKIVSAWCADDPNAALTALKAGQIIKQSTCDNPVAAQYALGQDFGIRGTPAIVLEDGRLIPGYRPAAELAESLGI